MKIVLVAVPIANTRIPPLSIALLSGYMKKHGYDVKSFDLNIDAFSRVEPELKDYWRFYMGHHWNDTTTYTEIIYPKIVEKFIDGWVNDILMEKPDVVGISVNTTPIVRELSKKIKAKNPKIKIILGGPTCSVVYGKISSRPTENEEAVVSGEGEETLLELVRSLEKNGEFKITKGATIFKDGNFIFGGEREPIMNLSTLAYGDFSDFDLSLYRDIDVDVPVSIPIYSSRGCVGQCAFCMDNRLWGGKWRPRDPEDVVKEMIFQYEKHGISEFTFTDLVINGSAKRLEKFADLLIESGYKFNFWAPARIDKRLTIPLLKKIKAAGLTHLNFGLESGSNRVLKLMKKGYDKKTASITLKNLYEAGLTCSVNLIAGYPGERWIDFFETIHFIYKHRKYIWNTPGVTDCAVIPGSELYDHPEKFGVVLEYFDHSAHYSWKSSDGKLNNKIRVLRKNIMNKFFSKLKFRSNMVN